MYPEEVWYTYVDKADIDEIIEEHLVHGRDRRAAAHMTVRRPPERLAVDGPAGKIEVVIDHPSVFPTEGADEPARGIALVAHPHPLFGGTLDNKVAQTLARTFAELGYVAVRPNFRGVGASEGAHDHGDGETDDLVRVDRLGAGPLRPAAGRARRLLVRRLRADARRGARAGRSAWCWSACRTAS